MVQLEFGTLITRPMNGNLLFVSTYYYLLVLLRILYIYVVSQHVVDIKEKSTSTTEQGQQQNTETQSVPNVQPPSARRMSTTAANPPSNNDSPQLPSAPPEGNQQPDASQDQPGSGDRTLNVPSDERDHNGDTPSYNMRLRRNTNNVNQDQNGYDNSGVAGDVQMQGQQGPPSRESAYVSMIAWSLDDSACIIATTYGDLKIFDSTTGELKGSLIGHTEETYAVDVHPTDPRTVLSAGYDGRAILWDLATFTQMSCHYYPERNLLDCKFSKDGKYFCSHCQVTFKATFIC
jgi:hypothetical protein